MNVAVIIVLVLCLAPARGISSASPSDDEAYVVIISIDGFPAWSLWDERIPLPAIRKLATEGAYAEAMIPSSPTVTWPNHTTLVTGVGPARHGLLFNGVLVRGQAGEPLYVDNERDKDEMVAVPTLYDVAHAAGLRTADSGWPATQNAQTIDDNFPGTLDNIRYMTPRLRTELIDLGLIDEGIESIWGHDEYGQVRRDFVWIETAKHLIRERRPNLLLLHLLNADGTHHQYGEGTVPGHLALSLSDMHVRDLLGALDEAGIRDRTTIFIVSDHGFMNLTHRVHPNVLLRENGLLTVNEAGEITNARVQAIATGGTASVFALDPATQEEDLETARNLFSGAEGIARILEPHEYDAYGLPHPSENAQTGDIILAADDGFAFTNAAGEDDYVVSLERTAGTHGYLADVPQMQTIFVASGRGVRSGVELGTIDNRSVAPTAARLLGITLETAEGQVLEEIME